MKAHGPNEILDVVSLFREQSAACAGELVTLRRDLHRHPELSFQEERTAAVVASRLEALGFTVRRGVGGTGVVGLLEGSAPGPVVALRADMDALPVQEETGLPFASSVPGRMHACGHDLHTTCVLGAATLLASVRHLLKGTVLVLFEPAEELNQGAAAMIRDGALASPKPDMIFGLHNHPEYPAGSIAVKEGPLMAAVDTLRLHIRGKGGHGALPHRDRDPIVAAASVIMNLQTLVSRETDPLAAAVVSFGTITGGTANNVIPDTVELTGTVRSFSPEVRAALTEGIRRVAGHTTTALGCTGDVTLRHDLPPVLNHPEATHLVRESALALAGPSAVVEPTPSMGGEDFALFQEQIPGCFFWLGVGNPDLGAIHPWHSPLFRADETSLPLGSSVLALAAWNALKKSI